MNSRTAGERPKRLPDRRVALQEPKVCTIMTSASSSFDVIVIGGTPGGVASAIAAARLGHSVALVEYHPHLGGMTTSGLGKSDIGTREMIRGLFAEFVGRVHERYRETYGPDSEEVRLCRDGYYYEPSVAEAVLDTLVAEQPGITVLVSHQFGATLTEGNAARGVAVRDRKTQARRDLRGRVVIDATYEGDAFASAGARYRLGRESKDAFNEPHAGVVYFDYQRRQFLPGTSHEGDDRLPAYTFRLCLTTDQGNAFRLTEAPPGYDRSRYTGYLEDLEAGRLAGPKDLKPGRGYYPEHFNTLVRALSVADIPNRKTDVNMNPRPLSFPFAEEKGGMWMVMWRPGSGSCRESVTSLWACSGSYSRTPMFPRPTAPWPTVTTWRETSLSTTATSPFSSTCGRRAGWSVFTPSPRTT